jgi:hypothetical protein
MISSSCPGVSDREALFAGWPDLDGALRPQQRQERRAPCRLPGLGLAMSAHARTLDNSARRCETEADQEKSDTGFFKAERFTKLICLTVFNSCDCVGDLFFQSRASAR